ncbi:NUDIX domain-containing protein [Streptomyces sp. NPDC014734]|uniref:NUDIX domain-containing protein n=1 Tax=Streptomyces sp. NPDC014734 TaxID=3364886 RepID=UPI0036FC6B89
MQRGFPRLSDQKSANPPSSPGGHVDVGETSLAAAVRELEEEAGITVPAADVQQVGAFDIPGRAARAATARAAGGPAAPSPRWRRAAAGPTGARSASGSCPSRPGTGRPSEHRRPEPR